MIYIPQFTTNNNNMDTIKGSLSTGSHSTARQNNRTKSLSMSSKPINLIRLLILCAAMLISFLTGVIVHAVSGSDVVQAASLTPASHSVSSPTNSLHTVSHSPTANRVIVLDGDTLWSIAKTHAPRSQDIRAYIEKIKHMNLLHSSGLQAGDVLLLP